MENASSTARGVRDNVFAAVYVRNREYLRARAIYIHRGNTYIQI